MFRKNVLSFAIIAAMSVTSACGGDDDDDNGVEPGDGDTPTQAEVVNIMSALSAIGSLAFSGQGALAADGLAAQTLQYSNTASCPNGGSTSVNGNYTLNTSGQSYTYNYTVTQTYSDCRANGGGTVYTFNGTGLTLTWNMVLNQTTQAYTYNFHESGNIGWAGGGKSGNCPIDITLSYSGGTSYVYSGTYCGVSITG
jgi:hypothetical protein